MGGAAGRGSMTIGRAVSLCLRNIGGQQVGTTSKSVFGQPGRLGVCFGEWEEQSPWPSLAEQWGYSHDDDVVTVHAAKGTHAIADINNDDPRDLLYLVAKSVAFPLSNKFLTPTAGNGQTVIAFNPEWAQRFVRGVPRRRRPQGLSLGTRVAADRAVAGTEPGGPRGEAPHRRERPRVPERTARPVRGDGLRRARQPARGRAPELGRQRAGPPEGGLGRRLRLTPLTLPESAIQCTNRSPQENARDNESRPISPTPCPIDTATSRCRRPKL